MPKGLWRGVWQGLNTPIAWEGAIKGGVDSLKTLEDLAKAINDNKTAKELEPLVKHFSSLLDVLSSPLGQVATGALPFVPLATGLLKYIVEASRQEPTLEAGVAIAAQAAYLKSIQVFLEQHPELVQRLSDQPASTALTKQIHQVGEMLEVEGKEMELTERVARETLICFHESPLAQIFNGLLSQRLEEAGLTPQEANRITERIARCTHRYLKQIVVEVRDQVKRLSAVYGEGWFQDQERYDSIDRYLEDVIARKPREPVFDEPFTYADLYVPLRVEPVNKEGKIDDKDTPQNIESWAESMLDDPLKQGQVLFVQGGPGRGKSVFCRMFADKVRREWTPIWIPVLIRLRDVQNFAQDFDKTLEDAIATDFTKDAGWLTDRNTRFLFFLDGFDELLLERGTTGGLQQFLEQVSLFQKRCAESSERSHRVVITGRPLALYGVERLMPLNLERVEIAPMAPEIQEQWLDKWESLIGKDQSRQFQMYLQNKQCPMQVKTLAKEPLLLYLLAVLHRDGKLQESQLTGDDRVSVRIQIYEAALEWVLTRQRSENGADLNPKITGLDPEDLRSILAEAGLCVVQSGGESAAIAMIEERLKEDDGAKRLLACAKRNAEKTPLKNALAAFYLKSTESKDNQIEFFHKSFGEFLCAERIAESLVRWTKKEARRGQPYLIREEMLYSEIDDLFGFGNLTPEIVEYLIGLLKNIELDWSILFERLEAFYLDWSDGRFIDVTGETLPQRKARQLQKHQLKVGQRHVDISTGLNVLILLMETHRHAQSVESLKAAVDFHPCGRPTNDNFEKDRLRRVINYSDCLQLGTFNQSVGEFFSFANLNGAILSGVDLSNADLAVAILSGAILSGAILSGAILSGAILSGAILSGAHLISTNLCGANLCAANLNSTDLSGAILNGADLSVTNLNNADLKNAELNNTNLTGADLRGAELIGAFLSSANLYRSNLKGANLTSALITGANLRRSNLTSANLSRAFLESTSLRDAILTAADLSYADLRSADLRGAYLSITNLEEIRWDEKTNWVGTQELHTALNVPKLLAKTPHFKAAVILSLGINQGKQGDIFSAVQGYQGALAIDINLTIDPSDWDLHSRVGVIHNQADKVTHASEKAIRLNPDFPIFRDTRGLARAMTGDFQGAIEDFEFVLKNLENGHAYVGRHRSLGSELQIQRRREWLETLKLGLNPITPEVLELLKKETKSRWEHAD